MKWTLQDWWCLRQPTEGTQLHAHTRRRRESARTKRTGGVIRILIVANSRLPIDHNHADVLAVTRSRQATFSHGYPSLLKGMKLVTVTKTPRGGLSTASDVLAATVGDVVIEPTPVGTSSAVGEPGRVDGLRLSASGNLGSSTSTPARLFARGTDPQRTSHSGAVRHSRSDVESAPEFGRGPGGNSLAKKSPLVVASPSGRPDLASLSY